jgi:hypothetical protein
MSIIAVTFITCSQAIGLFNRIQNNTSLTDLQKQEIIHEVRKVIPSCPIIIRK